MNSLSRFHCYMLSQVSVKRHYCINAVKFVKKRGNVMLLPEAQGKYQENLH